MIALDTNVLIYACDKADPRRQQIALDLISNTTDGIILVHKPTALVDARRIFKTRVPRSLSASRGRTCSRHVR